VGALQPDLQPRKSEEFFFKKNCGQMWNHKLQVKSQQMVVFWVGDMCMVLYYNLDRHRVLQELDAYIGVGVSLHLIGL